MKLTHLLKTNSNTCAWIPPTAGPSVLTGPLLPSSFHPATLHTAARVIFLKREFLKQFPLMSTALRRPPTRHHSDKALHNPAQRPVRLQLRPLAPSDQLQIHPAHNRGSWDVYKTNTTWLPKTLKKTHAHEMICERKVHAPHTH